MKKFVRIVDIVLTVDVQISLRLGIQSLLFPGIHRLIIYGPIRLG